MTREEAIKIVRNIYQTDKEKEALETLIPELKESEDERIRKGLIEALKTSKTVGELKFILPEPTREECIAYLEKQKEQKPAEWGEEEKPIPQEEFDAAKHESLWGEQKPAELKQGKQIEEGDKVKIHCREDRDKGMLSIYNDKVGEVISIWDAQRNPWGPIIVRLDNGCSNGFHEDELDVFDEPPILEKHY